MSMDVCLPHAMSPNTTVTTTGILYISEFLNQFGKALDLKSFNYQELSAIIFGGKLCLDTATNLKRLHV